MGHKKTIALLGATTGLSYLAYRIIGDEMINRIFTRKEYLEETEEKYLDWISASNASQIKVKSCDGLKLNAYDVHNHDDDRYMIMVHGSSSNKSALYPRAYEFDKMGYNLLLIDQRAAGDSEGEYCTYGVKEAQDLQIWISYLTKKYPDVRICLYGLSLGAVTVMMSAAYELPENVRCIIEESGFSSLEEELAYVIKKDYKIYFTYPVLKMLEEKIGSRFGMRYSDASAKICLENNEVPILFIHGEKDEIVPFDMAKILYNHNKGIKKFYPIAEAGHCQADLDVNYYTNVDAFISSCL